LNQSSILLRNLAAHGYAIILGDFSLTRPCLHTRKKKVGRINYCFDIFFLCTFDVTHSLVEQRRTKISVSHLSISSASAFVDVGGREYIWSHSSIG